MRNTRVGTESTRVGVLSKRLVDKPLRNNGVCPPLLATPTPASPVERKELGEKLPWPGPVRGQLRYPPPRTRTDRRQALNSIGGRPKGGGGEKRTDFHIPYA